MNKLLIAVMMMAGLTACSQEAKQETQEAAQAVRKPKRLPLKPSLPNPPKWTAKLFLKRTVKHATAA